MDPNQAPDQQAPQPQVAQPPVLPQPAPAAEGNLGLPPVVPAKKSNKTLIIVLAIVGPIVLLIAGLVIAGIILAANSKSSDDTQSVADKVLSNDIRPYKSIEHGFSINFPGQPVVEHETLHAAGLDIPYTLYTKASGESQYLVGVAEYPVDPSTIDTKGALEGSVNGSVNSITDGKLVSSTFTTHQGYEAIDATITGTDSASIITLHSRSVLVGNKLYTVSVVEDKALFDAFVDSFVLD